MNDFTNEHLRNAKIKVIKSFLITPDKLPDDWFNEEFLKNNTNQFSLTSAEEVAFQNSLKNTPKDTIQDLNSWLDKHKNASNEKHKLESIRLEISKKYMLLSNQLKNMALDNNDGFSKVINDVADKMELLHWDTLPTYNAQYINNNGVLPEENIKAFYNNYHAIEDFINFLDNPNSWKLTGAQNLNKKMKFSIYTNRWGHYDNYIVKRINEGWHFEFLTHSLKSKKDGTYSSENDGFYSILNNDSVFYPLEGIKYALSILWTEADETNMSVEQLNNRLREIGHWISEVNKTNYINQPSWVGYY